MKTVEIYTKNYCPFCQRAKALLDKYRVDYTEYEITDNPAKREEMIARSRGQKTVPNIFFGERHIGGFDDLAAIEAAGALEDLLKASVNA